MLRLIPILLLFVASPVWADDVPLAQKIWFPAVPVPDKAPVAPAPPADPDAVPTLAYGQIYPVQSEVEFFLRAYPKSLVTITAPVKGPVTARGIFTVGGKIETRVLTGKYVAFVDAGEKVSGRVDLVATPVGNANENSIVEQSIDVNTGPRPPPNPDEPVEPDEPDEPVVPTPAPTGFRVLFIYKTTANLSREQYNILYSTRIVDYLNSHCVKAGPSNLPEWRKWSPAITITDKESQTMRDLWSSVDHAKIADKLPQIVIAVNGEATTYPLPATEADTLALLKSKGGE